MLDLVYSGAYVAVMAIITHNVDYLDKIGPIVKNALSELKTAEILRWFERMVSYWAGQYSGYRYRILAALDAPIYLSCGAGIVCSPPFSEKPHSDWFSSLPLIPVISLCLVAVVLVSKKRGRHNTNKERALIPYAPAGPPVQHVELDAAEQTRQPRRIELHPDSSPRVSPRSSPNVQESGALVPWERRGVRETETAQSTPAVSDDEVSSEVAACQVNRDTPAEDDTRERQADSAHSRLLAIYRITARRRNQDNNVAPEASTQGSNSWFGGASPRSENTRGLRANLTT
ncbi:hypothetical protein FRC07_008611 [Ceratobasidium sp. 392]|nr:hypothetical protein FRC07_008611 [Ceratobasidium sp. 392]